MFHLTNRITIHSTESKDTYNLDFAESVQVSSGWESLCSVAKVSLPKKVYVNVNNSPFRISWEKRNLASIDTSNLGNSEKSEKKLFKVGDPIKIELGYNAEFDTVFEGFISTISAEVPFVLTCEDSMYILKRVNMSDELKEEATLGDLLNKINTAYNASPIHLEYLTVGKNYTKLNFETSIGSQDLSGYKINSKTVAQVFNELKANFDIETFIQDNTVYCGVPYPVKKNVSVKKILSSGLRIPEKKLFGFQHNIISNNLVAKSVDNDNVEVVVTGISPDGGTKAEVKQVIAGAKAAGDKGKPTQSIAHSLVPNILNSENKKVRLTVFTKKIDSLNGIAKRKLDKIRYTGYSGHFVTFGKPFIKHGDIVELQDFLLPERNGKFRVRKVDYSYGREGYRQKIELHTRVL